MTSKKYKQIIICPPCKEELYYPRRLSLADSIFRASVRSDMVFYPIIWSCNMGWEYSEKTKQLFMNAVHGKPGTHLGEIENPDGMGEHGSIVCGDAMRFTFRVKRHPSDPTQDVITEAKYLTFGCTSAIASSEALCEIIEAGKLYAHNGAEDPEQRYRRIPSGIAGTKDPLLRDGRRGARSRCL